MTGEHSLDYCKVHLKPSRDMDLEYFSSPASLIASMKIDFEHDKQVREERRRDNLERLQGILLRGEEKVKGYREVLSRIHYFNTRPEAYAKRIYSVQCSMLKGRVLSNEFIVTVSLSSALFTSGIKMETRLCLESRGEKKEEMHESSSLPTVSSCFHRTSILLSLDALSQI